MIQLEPLDGPFGRSVRGVDLSTGLADEDFGVLCQALYEHRVLVFKKQSIDKESFLGFGRKWGEPIPHVLDHLRMPGYPELLAIGNTGEWSKNDEVRNGAAFWHTDQSYEAMPATSTMLYSIKTPSSGGDTLIADMKAAYDGLDEEMKARINDLEAVHFYGATAAQDGEERVTPFVNQEQIDSVPPVRHKLARKHSLSGEKALFAVAGTAYAIDGMQDDEAVALIAELKSHALQDRYVYRHKYEIGDIAMWDTQMTLHSATPIDYAAGAGTERLLWRISVRGKPIIYN
jgi:taurine dioxygenase